MPRPNLETTTEITTAHKISVGLMVATAMVVVLATITAAIYTLATRSSSGLSVPLTSPTKNTEATPTPADPSTDRSFTTP
ncbi:MAG: hypothetical protein HY567_03960 [Candidatus Kerfeldbacteria bacterium]|nr:hypothetical protein [Candidatus Kerfeldbacteria bacterium]